MPLPAIAAVAALAAAAHLVQRGSASSAEPGQAEGPAPLETPSAVPFDDLKRDRRAKIKGSILYEGPSRFGGAPIAAVIVYETENPKTGPIPQVYIFRTDEYPTTKRGLDKAVCGRCPLAGGKGCYVNMISVAGVYKSFKKGNYSDIKHAAWWLRRNQPRAIRVGAYGDPVAIPNEAWVRLAAIAEDVALLSYTHQWPLEMAQEYKWFCMASVDSPAEMRRARAKGWRTYRAKLLEDDLIEGQVVCPAITEEDLTCLGCRACSGVGLEGSPEARGPAGIVVDVHGNPRALSAVIRTLKSVRRAEAEREEAREAEAPLPPPRPPSGSAAMAPGYRSWKWTRQDWRSVVPRGRSLDWSKKCGADGTQTVDGRPALCLPFPIIKRLQGSAEGRKILREQAEAKWAAKPGQRVRWHPVIQELHRELEDSMPQDNPRMRSRPRRAAR
jgi:hypothetical protein